MILFIIHLVQSCGKVNDTCGTEVTQSSRSLPCCEGYICTKSNVTDIDIESRNGVCKRYKAKENLDDEKILAGRFYN